MREVIDECFNLIDEFIPSCVFPACVAHAFTAWAAFAFPECARRGRRYFTGLVGFSFFEADFPRNSCNTSFHCTVAVLDLGFKENGGVGTRSMRNSVVRVLRAACCVHFSATVARARFLLTCTR